MDDVLQLNADYTPMKVLKWQRAVELVLANKVVLVADVPGRFVRSASLALPWPAVVALRRYCRVTGKVGYSGRNVAARDMWTCGYCGLRPRDAAGNVDVAALTIDHVVPRAQSKNGKVYLPWSRKHVPVSCWENAIAACRPCNGRKADRTPSQAGMVLRFLPRAPTQADALRIALTRVAELPEPWLPWLPGEWRLSGELAPDGAPADDQRLIPRISPMRRQ